MSYRKIEVDGVQYEYVIGKTHVKIKGVGVYLKEDFGESYLKHTETDYDFLKMHKDRPIVGHDPEYMDIRVKPSDVANKIKELAA